MRYICLVANRLNWKISAGIWAELCISNVTTCANSIERFFKYLRDLDRALHNVTTCANSIERFKHVWILAKICAEFHTFDCGLPIMWQPLRQLPLDINLVATLRQCGNPWGNSIMVTSFKSYMIFSAGWCVMVSDGRLAAGFFLCSMHVIPSCHEMPCISPKNNCKNEQQH